MAALLPTTAGKVAAFAVTILPPAPTAAFAAGSKKLNTNWARVSQRHELEGHN